MGRFPRVSQVFAPHPQPAKYHQMFIALFRMKGEIKRPEAWFFSSIAQESLWMRCFRQQNKCRKESRVQNVKFQSQKCHGVVTSQFSSAQGRSLQLAGHRRGPADNARLLVDLNNPRLLCSRTQGTTFTAGRRRPAGLRPAAAPRPGRGCGGSRARWPLVSPPGSGA